MKGLLGIALGAWVLISGWQAWELSRMAVATRQLQAEVGDLRATVTEIGERLEAVELDLDDLVAEIDGSMEPAAFRRGRGSRRAVAATTE